MGDSGNSQNVIDDSLAKARYYNEVKNYGRAFAHYLVVLQLLEPNSRQQYEKEFASVLHLWGSLLHQRGQYEDVFRCYNLAYNYFSTSVEILNNLGVHALLLKCFGPAKFYFEKALIADPTFLPAEQNLQSTKYALVERWHFPMLNDVVRNKAYAQAIFQQISHGATNILDIGMGTGILSLFAAKSNQSKNIVACDYSETMFHIATKVLEANNVKKVKLIRKQSSSLTVPADLPKRANLLITEIIDSGVFGENILDTLIHAWNNLLHPFPYGTVIPAAVSIYITGIKSNQIAHKNRYIPKENNVLGLNNIIIFRDTSPYDTENLQTANITYMTDTRLALYVDFNNILQLRTIVSTLEHNPWASLTCTSNGTIDCFAIWFKLHLNNDVSLTNDPRENVKTCWDQAIMNLKLPLPVIENEQIDIQLSCVDGVLDIAECKQSVRNCKNLHEQYGEFPKIFSVTKDEMLFLNDNLLISKIEHLVNLLIERFKDCDNMTVLDVSPFPILGLLLAEKGAKVTCRITNNEKSEELRCEVCRRNNISQENVKYVTAKNFNDYTSDNLRFDVIFQTLVSPCGLLFESEIYQAQVMKFSLNENGIYIPQSIDVWAQLVECDWLDQATKVDDKNVFGFKIAQFINEYKSTEQRDMNFNAIYHINLSEPYKIGSIEYNISNPNLTEIKLPITKTGRANAVFYWFDVNLYEGISVCTRRDESFAHNAAFVFETAVQVNCGQNVNLVLKQHRGILRIFINEPD